MKRLSIAVTGLALAFIVLTIVPSTSQYRSYFAVAALVCAAVGLVLIVVGWRERPSPAGAPPPPVDSAQNVAKVVPVNAAATPPAVTRLSGEADVIGFLATFQEKGRLVDFLQDDITAYSDAQVGAAARVVHQGCKAVLNEYFHIVPVREESEGAKVTVPAGYVADEYRLVGKMSGQAPFSGTLMHRGWKAQSVSLPRVLRAENDRFPTIAPAEVEIQ